MERITPRRILPFAFGGSMGLLELSSLFGVGSPCSPPPRLTTGGTMLSSGCPNHQSAPCGAHPGHFHLGVGRIVSDHRGNESRERRHPREIESCLSLCSLHVDDSSADAHHRIHGLQSIEQRHLLSCAAAGYAAVARGHRSCFRVQVGSNQGSGHLFCPMASRPLARTACSCRPQAWPCLYAGYASVAHVISPFPVCWRSRPGFSSGSSGGPQ